MLGRAWRRRRPEHLGRYPLRRLRWNPPAESIRAATARRDWDALLKAAIPGGPVPRPAPPRVPTAPDPDGRAVGELPRARALAERLADEQRLHPWVKPLAGDPFAAPWRDPSLRVDARDGPLSWGTPIAIDDLPEVERAEARRLLWKELAAGALEVVTRPEDALLLTPIFVVRQHNGKLRLVHDLRALNVRLKDATVKYETVRDALRLGGRVATKLDLAHAFKHVAVSDDLARHMCFAVGGVILRWRRLPFGLNWAPTAFTNALKPAIEELRARGRKVTVYVDDVYVAGDSVADLDDAVCDVMQTLARRGWRVAPDKTHCFAYDACPFLGLVVDLRAGSLRVAPSKADKLAALCEHELTQTRTTVHALQKIVGLLAFFLCAVPTVGLCWRGLRGALVEGERLPGRHVWRQGLMDAELRFWARHGRDLPRWPTPPVTDHRTSRNVATDASEDGTGALTWPPGTAPDLAAWAARDTDSTAPPLDGATAAAFSLSATDRSHASGVRELIGGLNGFVTAAREHYVGNAAWLTARLEALGVQPGSGVSLAVSDDTLRSWRRFLVDDDAIVALNGTIGAAGSRQGPDVHKVGSGRISRPDASSSPSRVSTLLADPTASAQSSLYPHGPIGLIRWFCDSTCATAALDRWRSPSDGMAVALLAIAVYGRLFGATIEGNWVGRAYGWIPAADFLSRVAGRQAQAEWSLGHDGAAAVCALLRRPPPSLDAYATRENRVCDRFRARFPEPGSEGAALDSPWPYGTWAFPPFSQAAEAVQHWLAGPRRIAILVLATGSPAVRMATEAGAILRKVTVPRSLALTDPAGRPAPTQGRPALEAALLGTRAVHRAPAPGVQGPTRRWRARRTTETRPTAT